MEAWAGVIIGAVMVLAVVFAVRSIRHARSRPTDVVLRIDTSNDPNVPLTIVNAGRDPVFHLEATLRFEGRAPGPEQVMERHRRALILLPGERLTFSLPEDITDARAAEHATLVRRVQLEAVARDSKGRPLQARDVLQDPLTWIESERRSRSAVHTSPPRKGDR